MHGHIFSSWIELVHGRLDIGTVLWEANSEYPSIRLPELLDDLT